MDKRNRTYPTEFIFQAFSNSTKFPGLLFTLFVFLYLLILMWNFTLMLVIKTDSRLHTPMYFLLFNLSCMDICNTTTLVPQTLYNLISGRHTISFLGCAAQMFFIIVFGGAQIVMITNMAYDRCAAITNPLRYNSIMTLKACVILSTTPWLVASAMATVMVYFVFQVPFCDNREINHFFCDAGQVLWITCPNVPSHRTAEFVTFFMVLFFFAFNFLFVVASYVLIIKAIMRIGTKQGQQKAFSTCSSHLNVVVVEYACLGFLYLRPTSAYAIDKDRIFFMVLFFFAFNFLFVVASYVLIIKAIMRIGTKQGQQKAFSTCSSHLNVVVVEYACLGFLYLRPTSAYAIDKDRIFVIVFTFGTPILNPLVYSVRNKAVKIGFKKLF